MARGLTLGEVVTLVREESGQSTNAAFGQATAETIRAMIRRTYRRLHADWNWPHLRITRDETLSAGSRYYSFDADMDPDRMTGVWTKEFGTDVWLPVAYGINPEFYNILDPAEDEREDPVRAWDFYEGGQYEVWPVPQTASTLRFIGLSKPKTLAADSDKIDLDGDMIALYVAAEILARQKAADAQAKLEQAAALYHRLKANGQKAEVFPIQRKRTHWRGIQVRAPRT